jgi:hypothetical protein
VKEENEFVVAIERCVSEREGDAREDRTRAREINHGVVMESVKVR